MLHQTIICSFRKPAHFLILDHLKAPKSSINCLKSSRKRVNLEKVEFLENIGKLKQIIEQQGNTIDTTMQIIDTKDKLIEILNKLIDIKQIFMEIKDMQIKSLEKKIGSLKGVKSSVHEI